MRIAKAFISVILCTMALAQVKLPSGGAKLSGGTNILSSNAVSVAVSMTGDSATCNLGSVVINEPSPACIIVVTNGTGSSFNWLQYDNFNLQSGAANKGTIQANGDTIVKIWGDSCTPNYGGAANPQTVVFGSGATCQIKAYLDPSVIGASTGQVFLVNAAGTTLSTINLSGTGVADTNTTVALPNGIAADYSGTVMNTHYAGAGTCTTYSFGNLVTTGANLTTALAAASQGDTICVSKTASISGNWTLRNTGSASTSYITIRSDDGSGNLPAGIPTAGSRICNPHVVSGHYISIADSYNSNCTSMIANMATITNACTPCATGTFTVAPGAHNYRFVGLNLVGSETINAGGNTLTDNYADSFIFDRVYAHQDTSTGYGEISIGGTTHIAVIDSWIEDDSTLEIQDIGFAQGNQYIKVVNNVIVGSGGFITGGDIGYEPSTMADTVAQDIEIRGNDVFRPMEWDQFCGDVMTITSVDAASGGNTTYHGTIPDGAANALAGLQFLFRLSLGGGITTTSLTTGGTGYTTASGLSVTGGSGTSATVNITASGGVISAVTINAAGSSYGTGQVLTVVQGGGSGGTFTITGVGGSGNGQYTISSSTATTLVVNNATGGPVSGINVAGFVNFAGTNMAQDCHGAVWNGINAGNFKSLVESKGAQRVLVIGNIIEQGFSSQGYSSFLYSNGDQHGNHIFVRNRDLTSVRNIVRYGDSGHIITGSSFAWQGLNTKRVYFADNLYYGLCGTSNPAGASAWGGEGTPGASASGTLNAGGGNCAGVTFGSQRTGWVGWNSVQFAWRIGDTETYEHNTFLDDDWNALAGSGFQLGSAVPIVTNLIYRNNVLPIGTKSFNVEFDLGCTSSLSDCVTLNGTASNAFGKNVMFDHNDVGPYNSSTGTSCGLSLGSWTFHWGPNNDGTWDNFFCDAGEYTTNAQFTNSSNAPNGSGNFTFQVGSPFHNWAADGADPGIHSVTYSATSCVLGGTCNPLP